MNISLTDDVTVIFLLCVSSWFTTIDPIVAAQVRSRMATKYGPSIGSFHRVLACSAGGPGFDSWLRRNILRCSMQRMLMALVKPLHSGDPDMMRNSHATTCIPSDLHAYTTRNRITFSHVSTS
jgi:hypothetical protein